MTGLEHRPVADGRRVTGIYRRNVVLDDGMGFMPCKPVMNSGWGSKSPRRFDKLLGLGSDQAGSILLNLLLRNQQLNVTGCAAAVNRATTPGGTR